MERFRDQITRVKDAESVPLMLVGNKCHKITKRQVSREEGMNMARKLKCEFIESCAKTCVNVERAFYTVVRMIRNNRDGGREYRRRKKSKVIKAFDCISRIKPINTIDYINRFRNQMMTCNQGFVLHTQQVVKQLQQQEELQRQEELQQKKELQRQEELQQKKELQQQKELQ